MIRKKTQRNKKRKRNRNRLWLLSVCFAAAGVTPALAAPVQEIRLHLRAEEFDERGMPVLEADTADASYTVTGTEPLWDREEATGPAAAMRESEQAQAGENGTENPEPAGTEPLFCYEVGLSSETEEGFSVLTQKQIHISGEKAVCVKAVRSDQRQTLRLTLELTEPKEVIGEIEQVRLEQGTAVWTPAPAASAYYVILYRNGKRLRDGHRTEGCCFDFSALMKEAGSYACRVFPLTEKGRKGIAAESGRLFLDAFQAEQIQENWKTRLEEVFAPEELENSGWLQAAGGWYYKNRDGTFAVSTRLELEGKQYQFDEAGRWTGETFAEASPASMGS